MKPRAENGSSCSPASEAYSSTGPCSTPWAIAAPGPSVRSNCAKVCCSTVPPNTPR